MCFKQFTFYAFVSPQNWPKFPVFCTYLQKYILNKQNKIFLFSRKHILTRNKKINGTFFGIKWIHWVPLEKINKLPLDALKCHKTWYVGTLGITVW